MKITSIISSLDTGGAENTITHLANHWALNNHQVSLITFAPPESKPFYPLDKRINLIQLNQSGIEPRIIQRLVNILKRIFCLRNTLKKLNPDVIVSFMDTTNVTTLLASWGQKIPLIVSERTHPKYNYLLSSGYKNLRNLIYKKAEHVAVQTKSTADYFIKLKNVCIIPNPVFKPLYAKSIDRHVIQQIISSGRLCPSKNFDLLIKVFATIITHYPNLKLTIYGEGVERSNLEQLIVSLNLQNKVFLPGVTNNIQEALSKSDLFIFPSQYEGFPNALCEAMACGLPVIASNCSGNIDIVRDGTDGRLFPVGDIEALTSITLELIRDPDQCHRLSENAKTICERFETSRIYALWDDLIERCKIKSALQTQ